MHTSTMYIYVRIFMGLVCALGFLWALPASAAQLLPQVPDTYAVGEQVVIPVLLSTEGESVNAVEGNLRYPSSLKLVEIRDGNSLVTFWLERPAQSTAGIHFSGITPGGFVGVGEVFSLVFAVTAPVSGTFSIEDSRALLNDGQGTAKSLTVGAAQHGTGTVLQHGSVEGDTTPPDTFTPTLTLDPYLHEGKAVVVFATQDKGSGIDHYEVAEHEGFKTLFVGNLSFVRAESPYVLTDQELHSYIYVRAIDKAGNVRTAMLSPRNLPLFYNVDVLAAILVLLLVLVFAIQGYVQKRHLV